jgi:AcrR family transcriptional regulator
MGPDRQKRTNDPVGMRNRVLDVAARAFQAVGYNATSTHDIVRAAGVTSGALHHHFRTKKALGLAVIDERVTAEIADTWIATVRDAPSARDGILQVFRAVTETLDECGAVSGCPLGNLALELSLADADLRAALVAGYRDWRVAIADRIRRDQETGIAAYAADPEAFASMVVAMFSGAMVIAKAEQDTAAVKACAGQLKVMMRD